MMSEETWFDDAAGPLVRPYAMTRGRTRTSRIELDVVTLVLAVPYDPNVPITEPEYWSILTMCQRPTSIAELSAKLDLPLGVIKVLVGDLIERRQVIFRSAMTPEPEVLQAVLDGIRRL
jgi:uncharacterized protein DUF742